MIIRAYHHATHFVPLLGLTENGWPPREGVRAKWINRMNARLRLCLNTPKIWVLRHKKRTRPGAGPLKTTHCQIIGYMRLGFNEHEKFVRECNWLAC